MGFSRQEYWSGWPCPPPGDLPDAGTELASLLSLALAGNFLPLVPPGEKEMATHSSILAYRILWTEEPGGLLSIGSHGIGHN